MFVCGAVFAEYGGTGGEQKERTLIRSISIVLAATCIAGAAQASFFSFASDRNPDGPTFAGATTGPGVVRDGRPFDGNNSVSVNFLADLDEDGPNAPQSFDARFEFDGNLSGYQMISFGTRFVHVFNLDGAFSVINNADDTTLFQATFRGATFASISNSAGLLGQSASLSNDDAADASLVFTTGGALAGVGVDSSRDFVFTLTNLRLSGNGGRVGVTPGGSVSGPWIAEGSFSAQAVPSAGSLALLGLGLGAMGRRRR